MTKKEQILEYFKDINVAYNNSTMLDTLKHMLEDLEEVRHGRWIEAKYPLFTCSECGATYQDNGYGYNYCPHCGARCDL